MTSTEWIRAAYERIAAVDRPEAWIHLRPLEDALADAAAIDARVVAGESLPLAGLAAALNDNKEVAGIPTTAGAPSYR